jgi:hypothetical protein
MEATMGGGGGDDAMGATMGGGGGDGEVDDGDRDRIRNQMRQARVDHARCRGDDRGKANDMIVCVLSQRVVRTKSDKRCDAMRAMRCGDVTMRVPQRS